MTSPVKGGFRARARADKATERIVTIRILWIMACVVIIGIAAYGYDRVFRDELPPVSIGGPFTLTDHNGHTVSNTDFPGQFLVVYFGYTYCPDVCPMSLQTLSDAFDMMDPALVAKMTPLLISIDPDRDTPEQLKDYVANFHERLIGLTGTRDQIMDVAKKYRVFADKAGDDPESYLMDHTALFYLMAPSGEYLMHAPYTIDPERLAKRLAEYL
jgi:cytochrome oxidase Cu insertion factor (SCO1/SenC/PrrC family)